MTLPHILVLLAAALIYSSLIPPQWRGWFLFAGSVLGIYWLHPPLLLQWLDFAFPTLTLGLVLTAWTIVRPPGQRITRDDILAASLIACIVLLLSFGRYIMPAYRLTPSIPPPVLNIVLWGIGLGIVLAVVGLLHHHQRRVAAAMILLLLGLFIVLKTENLAEQISRYLRDREGRSTALARASELEWLGFSYVAFRLIHTLRDLQTGRLPSISLREYTAYCLFLPAFTAGPIDRIERFLTDWRALPQLVRLDPTRFAQGITRIAVGIGKKFIVADTLAFMALDPIKATQVSSPAGSWLLLYLFSLQIYLDFSGYSDIAIGLGQLVGIRLPENFSQPYLKRNITVFWQSWHMTLSQWVRAYVFLPLSRALLNREHTPSPLALALIGQVTTMVVIGLWHGVTWSFVVWGLWHGLGLFVHRLWSDKTRPSYIRLRERPLLSQVIGVIGTFLTFHFVTLGWVWFALPDPHTSWSFLIGLFGVGIAYANMEVALRAAQGL